MASGRFPLTSTLTLFNVSAQTTIFDVRNQKKKREKKIQEKGTADVSLAGPARFRVGFFLRMRKKKMKEKENG